MMSRVTRSTWWWSGLAVLALAACGDDGPLVLAAPHDTTPSLTTTALEPDELPPLEPRLGPDASANPTSTLPVVPAPTTAPPPTTAPGRLPDTVAVVGDSLTLSAVDQIGTYLESLDIDVVAIDGEVSRRMVHGTVTPGIDVIDRIAAHAAPELWVIALGTNDVGAGADDDQFAADVATVLAHIPGGAPVLWVDAWIADRQADVERANTALEQALAGRAATSIVDWFREGQRSGITGSDGVHLTNDGRHQFAAAIADGIVAMSQSSAFDL